MKKSGNMWARVATMVLGLWLMIAPGILRFPKVIADNGHIVGPLLVTFAAIALSECTRNVRWLNIPLGAWLLFAPWILHYESSVAFVSDYTTGVLTLIFSLAGQKRKHYFSEGWYGVIRSHRR